MSEQPLRFAPTAEVQAGLELLAALRERGLTLRLLDGEARVGPARLVDEATRNLLAEHRMEIMLALSWEPS